MLRRYKKVIDFWKNYIFKKYLFLWLCAIFLECLHYLFIGFIPVCYKILIDALGSKNFSQLKLGIISYISFQFLSLIALLLQRISRYKIELNVWKDLNIIMHRKYHTISYAETLKFPPGEIMQRFVDDLWFLSPLISYAPSALAGYIVFFIIIFLLTIKLSPFLWAILFLYVIIYFLGYKYYYLKKIPVITQTRQKVYSCYTKELEESLNNTYDIRLNRGLEGVTQRFMNILKNYIKAHFNFLSLQIFYQGIFTNGLLGFTTALVLLTGTYLLLKGLLSVGTLVAFVSYNKYLYDLISFFTALTQTVEPSMVSLDRINNILKMKEVYIVKSPKKVNLLDNYPYALEIKDLDFRFNNIEVFHKLNLVIKKNTFTAIYGESGVGKTTLLNLLFKLYDVPNGKIFIFGKDINEFSLEEIFGIISCVTQEPKFFTDTPLNNLKIFHSELNEERLKFLIHNLGIKDKFSYFIRKEGEAKLLDFSGGERKLLGIIRGLLSDTSIWILDEPTSFLDKLTSKKILEFLKYNSKNKTIIVFSHDIVVREFADEVIEIKKERL